MSDKVSPTQPVTVACDVCGCTVGALRLPHAWTGRRVGDPAWFDASPAQLAMGAAPPRDVEAAGAVTVDGHLLWPCPRCSTRGHPIVVGVSISTLQKQYEQIVGAWYSDSRNRKSANLSVATLRVPHFSH